MLNLLNTPVVIAHRGASAHAVENSIPAFLLALEQGADALEMDLQLTADKEVVVFHDDSLSRMVGIPSRIRDLTLQKIQEYTLIKNSPDSSLAHIPSLDDVFSSLPKTTLYNLELKNLSTPFDPLPGKVAQIILKHNLNSQVLISSFNPIALRKFRAKLPDIPLGRLYHNQYIFNMTLTSNLFLSIYTSIHVPYKSINHSRVSTYQNLGKLVFTYTLNKAEDISKAMRLGVDGIFTDDPGLAINVLAELNLR
jgi:glycerophosphoryl diester phosphodiesterase